LAEITLSPGDRGKEAKCCKKETVWNFAINDCNYDYFRVYLVCISVSKTYCFIPEPEITVGNRTFSNQSTFLKDWVNNKLHPILSQRTLNVKF
jgi:hypothetical protein